MGEECFSQMLSTHLDKFQTRQNSKWAKVTRIFKLFPDLYGRVKGWVEGVYILLTPPPTLSSDWKAFQSLTWKNLYYLADCWGCDQKSL